MPDCCQTAAWGHIRVNSAQLSLQIQRFRNTWDYANAGTFILTSWKSDDIPQPKRKQTGSNISPAWLYIPLWQMMQVCSFESREGLHWKWQCRTRWSCFPYQRFSMWNVFQMGNIRGKLKQYMTTIWVQLYSFIFEFCRNCRPIVSSINMK